MASLASFTSVGDQAPLDRASEGSTAVVESPAAGRFSREKRTGDAVVGDEIGCTYEFGNPGGKHGDNVHRGGVRRSRAFSKPSREEHCGAPTAWLRFVPREGTCHSVSDRDGHGIADGQYGKVACFDATYPMALKEHVAPAVEAPQPLVP
jgi:hypothetical protein